MALTLRQQHTLINAAPFNGRVEAAVTKFAVYRQNTAPDAWSKNVLEDANYRLMVVNTLRWYVLSNVAAAGDLTEDGDDSTALDAAVQGEVETQITRIYGA